MTVKIRFGISQPHLLTVFIFFQFTDDNASVPQFYAGGMKRFCHFPDMVRPHIIHDHDVSLLQARNENLLQVCQKALSRCAAYICR